MCGIVSALTFDPFEKKSEERIRNEANIFITTQLLQATVERGKDATGTSLLWADGNYTGLKMGIPSPDFICRFGETEKDFAGFLKLWREYPKLAKIFLGHCRKSSVGNSYDNKNNHPIQVGHMIVAHNGTLTNHEKIFDKLDVKRIGDVDSEAIGHLLNHYTNGGNDPFTVEMIEEVTRRLAGTYHVVAMSGNNPFQIAQFRDGRPAEMVLVRPLKTVYIASEKKFLENILVEFNKQGKLFSSSVKFPYLKQADVEFKTLQDDSLAVWDLTVPIDDKTEIADLYDWKKTPLRVDKIWGSTTSTTYNNNSTYNSSKKSTGTEVSANTKKTGTSKSGKDTAGDDDASGLVWSKSLNKYKTQDGITDTKEYGAVTIDVDKATITPVEEADEGEVIDVKEVDKDDVENLITGEANVSELAIKDAEDAANAINDDKKNSPVESDEAESEGDGDAGESTESRGEGGEDSGSTTVEVDMEADPEALKVAEDFVDGKLTKYEKDEEVCDDLDVSDPSVLRPLPVYALANRIKKFIFKQGFIAGFIARKKAVPDAIHLGEKVAPAKKLENAEDKIRRMKMVIRIMAECLEMRCRGNSTKAVQDMIAAAVDEVYSGSKVDLSMAFSVGDIKNIPLLKEIKERMNEEN